MAVTDSSPKTKTCTTCHMQKTLEYFYRRRHGKYGRHAICCDCNNAIRRARYASLSPEKKEVRTVTNRKNVQKYNKTHREHRNIASRLRRARNANNPVKIQAKRKAAKTWRDANPEKIRAFNAKSKALRKNAPIADFTAAQWVMMQEIQRHRCYYCHKQCKGRLTQDHIIPLSKGGAHTLSNIVGACKSCNSSKGNRHPPKPVQALLL